jgi:hypothetical protein
MEISQGNSLFSYLYLNKQECYFFSFFFYTENRRAEQVLLMVGLVPGIGERWGSGVGG